MYASSIPASRGMGTPESFPKHVTATATLPGGDRGPIHVDGLRLSRQATLSVWPPAIDISAFDRPGGSGLLAAARQVHLFLADHPRVAGSAFGKSAALLVRAALELETRGELDHLPVDSKARIGRAVDSARTFLADHPRVAESPMGVSVAEMARAIATAIAADKAGNQTQLADWLMEAAKRAELYLDEYPTLASMPLGEVVSKLVDGVRSLADGNPLDANLQTLAKRVGYYLESHPRLAQSEFGQLVAPLGRGIAAIDVATGPEAKPPAGDAVASAAAAAVVPDVNASTAENGEIEMRKAA